MLDPFGLFYFKGKMENRIKSNFSVVRNDILRNREISVQAKGVYAYLCSMSENWIFHNNAICKDLDFNIDTYKKYEKELIEFGAISKEIIKNSSQQTVGMKIVILDNPLPKKPVEEKPVEEISSQENFGSLRITTFKNTNKKKNNLIYSDEKSEFDLLSLKLKNIVQKNKRVNITDKQLKTWSSDIKNTFNDLKIRGEEVALNDIKNIFFLLEKDVDTIDKYKPVIESGKSFREKFSKIENYFKRKGIKDTSFKRASDGEIDIFILKEWEKTGYRMTKEEGRRLYEQRQSGITEPKNVTPAEDLFNNEIIGELCM
jgi:hypothetical protein